jgi:hypothetical protein
MIPVIKDIYRYKLSAIPSILVCGETPDHCSCDEIGTKEVIYYRQSFGMLKKFSEIICEECLSDPEYFLGKTIVSIRPYKSDEQEEKDYYSQHIF